MKYTLLWKKNAEDRLFEIWLASDARNGVTAAINEIDRLLQRDPDLIGESRTGNERILIVPPISVAFEVSVDDRIVTILSVNEI